MSTLPVRESVTSTSGVPWSTSLPRSTAPPSARADLEALVIREKLDVDGLYTVLL